MHSIPPEGFKEGKPPKKRGRLETCDVEGASEDQGEFEAAAWELDIHGTRIVVPFTLVYYVIYCAQVLSRC